MSKTANFFWHGKALSLYERCSLLSFVQKGFYVQMWAYQPFEVPDTVTLCDASTILPATDLQKYTQAGKKGDLAAFSDAFRYTLLKKQGGWWFDMDMLCLKPVSEFERQFDERQPIVIGRLDDHSLGGAVLRINQKHLIDRIIRETEDQGSEFAWGEIGPKLLTRIVQSEKLDSFVANEKLFYSVHANSALELILPASLEKISSLCTDSFTLHFYNEFLSRWKIPKNVLPPRGSYLYNLFLTIDPSLKSLPDLPEETVIALVDAAAIYDEWVRLKRVEGRLKNNLFYQSAKKIAHLIGWK